MEEPNEIGEIHQTASLFPVFHQTPPSAASTAEGGSPEWLCNTSFNTDLNVINDAVARNYKDQLHFQEEASGEDEEEEAEKGNSRKGGEGAQYQLVDSSASDRGYSSGEVNERRKKKKRKKSRRREERSGYARPSYKYGLSSSSRKPGVKSWAASSGSGGGADTKGYYFDSRGDRDNLAFGSLYRMDVARYKAFSSAKMSEHSYYWRKRNKSFEGDGDLDALDRKLRSDGRYWSAKYAALERLKNLKRIRVVGSRVPLSTVTSDFIPLIDEVSTSESLKGLTIIEESWEDEVLRKTKEFNKMSRERPHDEKVWLEFAEFQDQVASMQPQKGARLQTLEKKISILEKAIELNPENENLLLLLMNAYRSRDSVDVLFGRWKRILVQNSGSYKLWREFLRVVQSEFSRFKVSEIRKIYANAIQALSSACIKQYRQFHQRNNAASTDPTIAQVELNLVDIFLCLCRFEWQTGYQELATALLQAEIEYSLFCPSLLLSEQSKHKLFEHFWDSNGVRIGEDGALGWSTWLGKEEEQRQKDIHEKLSHDDEGGGWTGWSEPSSKTAEVIDYPENTTNNDLDEESEMKDVEHDDDDEDLIKMLGIDAAAGADSEVKDNKTWTRWSEEELSRDCEQWMPVRPKSAEDSYSKGVEDAEDDEQLLRAVAYEDISDYLFSIHSEEARLSLVFQFLDFYGGRVAPWTCTNSSSWEEKTFSVETLPYSILDNLRRVHDVLTKAECNPLSISLELLLNNSDDISKRSRMMKFLRNATLLCLTAFPQNYILEEAALVAEELSNSQIISAGHSVTPSRALAKSLLKSNRQDVLLCGVYARREAVFGNIDHSRKVFDMALLSLEGLPQDIQAKASLLFLWYAEMELGNNSIRGSESSSRALHILSCFGSNVKYSPYNCQPSSLQLLRARQGFKDQMKMLRVKWSRGLVDDYSVALFCSSALFEELTTGWEAGIEIFDQAFTMVLPERRRQSYHLELLFNSYTRMLLKNHNKISLSKLWEVIVKGLQMYPYSPDIYNALVEIVHLHTSPNKLRCIFDDYCRKKPSVVVLLFALSFEMGRGSSIHRIRGLFERALENENLRSSVVIWRCYISYEISIVCNPSAARRVFFRAIHACPWSKKLWLDGFLKLNSVLTAKELSDLHEVMRDKELNLRTDIYEILLQNEIE